MRLLVPLVLLILASSVKAQSDEAVRPPLDAAAFFTDAVEIVEAVPLLNVDNINRAAYYFAGESTTWQTYPYPDELDEIFRLYQFGWRADGSVLLYEERAWDYESDPLEKIWQFDPASGFMRPEAACGVVKALPGEGDWKVIREGDLARLCFTETGELSAPLPTDGLDAPCSLPIDAGANTAATTSPDGQWVIVANCEVTTFTLYAFHLADETLHHLGVVEGREDIYPLEWIDDSTLLIFGFSAGTFSSRPIYLVDAAEENGLSLIASQFMVSPVYSLDPPRYLWMEDYVQAGDSMDVYQYDLATRTQTTIGAVPCPSTPTGCQPRYPIPNNSANEIIAALDAHPQAPTLALTVYDTAAEQTLYEATLPSWGLVAWADENTLLTMDVADSQTHAEGIDTTKIIRFDGGEPIESSIDYFLYDGTLYFPPRLSPNNRCILTRDVTSINQLRISAFDLDTQTHTVIIDTPLQSHETIEVFWELSGWLRVIWVDKSFNPSWSMGDWRLAIGC